MSVSYDDRRVWSRIDSELKDDIILKTINTLECLICSEVMHVPFLAQCGHSFCYSCLNAWFETKVNCPTCRTELEYKPILNIPLKDISKSFTDIVIDSIEDSKLGEELIQAREQHIIAFEYDNKKNSLFGDAFNNAITMIDRSDGVPRCGNCHWEAHGNVCLHCGSRFRIPQGDLYYDSEDGDAYNEDDDEVEMFGITGEDRYDSEDSFVDNRGDENLSQDQNQDELSSSESAAELWYGGFDRENLDLLSVDSNNDLEGLVDRLHRRDVAEHIDLDDDLPHSVLSADLDLENSDVGLSAETDYRRGARGRPVVLDLDDE